MPTGGLDVAAGSFLAGAVGETAAGVLGTAALGAETGAALGGLEGAVTGGNVGKGILHGAEGGALTGGGIGIGGDIASGLGASAGSLGAIAGSGLGGAAGGALGGVVTGGNPLTSALEGGISGGIAGSGVLSSGAPASTPSAGVSGGGVAGAGGGAAPVGVDTSGSTGLPWQDPSNTGISPSLQSASQAVNNAGELSTTGSPASGSNLPGTPGVGSGLTSQFSQGAGGVPSLNSGGIDSLASASNAAAGGEVSVPNSFSKFISNRTLGNAGNILASNPGAAISAAGLGLDALKGNQKSGAEKNLETQAGQLSQQGNQLQGYLQSGTLPPGLQAGINQASESAKASIRSQYASMGLSGSSAEKQELAAVDQRAQAQTAQQAEQLLSIGISETGMSSQLYQALMGDSLKNDQNLSSAISNFASAASGNGNFGKGGQTITIGGAS